MDKINEFKHRGESDFNQIKVAFPNVTAIWLIFLAHTINKEAFPIFDQHVYRAMHFLETREASELTSYSNPIKISIYQERYLPFYRQYRDQAKSYKDWNEALWAFGKFFRQYKNVFLSQGLTF